MADAAVTIAQAAHELGRSARQLEAYLAAGAPVARRGRRGRGCATLVDVAEVRAWLAARDSTNGQQQLSALAGAVPEIVADAIYAAFVGTEGPHKRAFAGTLASAWYRVTCALRERIGVGVPEPSSTPEKIAALVRIFSDSGTVSGSKSP